MFKDKVPRENVTGRIAELSTIDGLRILLTQYNKGWKKTIRYGADAADDRDPFGMTSALLGKIDGFLGTGIIIAVDVATVGSDAIEKLSFSNTEADIWHIKIGSGFDPVEKWNYILAKFTDLEAAILFKLQCTNSDCVPEHLTDAADDTVPAPAAA